MFRPFIIEDIRRREQEKNRKSQRHPLRVELPQPDAMEPPRGDKPEPDEREGGTVIIDFTI